MNDNVRDMDSALKEEIYWFFKVNYEMKQGFAKDFIDELELYLKQEGFDLGCIRQYKNVNK